MMDWVSCNLVWNCDWSAIIVIQVGMSVIGIPWGSV